MAEGSAASPPGPTAGAAATAAESKGESLANGAKASAESGCGRSTVSAISVGVCDSAGRRIDIVYAKKEGYAIYGCAGLVVVQYADDAATASRQAPLVDAVGNLRGKLEYLAGALRSRRRAFYFRQLANGLQAALDGEAEVAKLILQQAIDNTTQDLMRAGRKSYLIAAAIIAAGLAALLILIGGLLRGHAAESGLLLVAAGSGAIGAMLSIAIAFRNRTVAPDQDFGTNLIDGALRVGIGVISGFFLPLMLTSGLLGPLSAGGVPGLLAGAGPGLTWKTMLAIGFVAGFLERLVPDLLEKAQAQESQGAGKAGEPQSPGKAAPG